MDKFTKEFFLLLFIVVLGCVCFYFGMQIREVKTYTCVYTYERQGAFATTRYYHRSIQCSPELTEFDLCRGGTDPEVSEQTGSFFATEKDVASASYYAAFFDELNINTTALDKLLKDH